MTIQRCLRDVVFRTIIVMKDGDRLQKLAESLIGQDGELGLLYYHSKF
ncbi:MAG TPA: hypothetical protein IGS40_19570 [Trichormus sp. M33_DOE_039]|nr:hypothetical protein [Trichormus sp. M33_DOE_039]